ncbi:uncharacterized protein [Dermacentor albipictus]|uniref:uncharacterized protein n=1 Tax=Dermacentor albipictus TaxID=60249 RepID=UPI0038FD09F4
MAAAIAHERDHTYGANEPGQDIHANSWSRFIVAFLVGITFGGLLRFLDVSLAYSSAHEPTSSDAAVARATQESFPEQSNHSVCYTAACVRTAKELLDSINPVVPPCDNFQEYVCGRRQLTDNVLNLIRSSALKELMDKFKKFLEEDTPQKMDARHRAAYLFASCLSRSSSTAVSAVETLKEFAKKEGLHLTGPPADVPTGPTDVLSLHVHLSFTYMLGGLLRIIPSTPGTLLVQSDDSFSERTNAYEQLSPEESNTYFTKLASLGSDQVTQDLLTEYQELHSNVLTALTTGALNMAAGDIIRKGSFVVHTNADLVVIDGIEGQAFAESVETKTPYPRDAAVDMDPLVPIALGAIWRGVSSDKLYLWTGWSVLDQLARYVDPWIAERFKDTGFFLGCLDRIRHALGVPFAAIALPTSQTARYYVETAAQAIVECLAKDAHRWLLPPVATRKRAEVVVGFPPGEDTLRKLDERYAAYLDFIHDQFLQDYLEVMKIRKQRLNISHVHFDPSDVDVVVSGDGLVVVPAAAVLAFYRDGDLTAINLGSLGQMIGTRFIQRFRLPSSQLKPECLAPVDSKTDNVFETLLTHQCTRKVLSGSDIPNTSTALFLPMHHHMTPARQLFVAACFKRCRTRNNVLEANCEADTLRRLRIFNDAFACQMEEPACEIP